MPLLRRAPSRRVVPPFAIPSRRALLPPPCRCSCPPLPSPAPSSPTTLPHTHTPPPPPAPPPAGDVRRVGAPPGALGAPRPLRSEHGHVQGADDGHGAAAARPPLLPPLRLLGDAHSDGERARADAADALRLLAGASTPPHTPFPSRRELMRSPSRCSCPPPSPPTPPRSVFRRSASPRSTSSSYRPPTCSAPSSASVSSSRRRSSPPLPSSRWRRTRSRRLSVWSKGTTLLAARRHGHCLPPSDHRAAASEGLGPPFLPH